MADIHTLEFTIVIDDRENWDKELQEAYPSHWELLMVLRTIMEDEANVFAAQMKTGTVEIL
jgi:hypothetical protein